MKEKEKLVFKMSEKKYLSNQKQKKQDGILTEYDEEIEWREDSGVFSLEGEDVLLWSVKLPILPENKKKGKWVQQYYEKVEKTWKKRWEDEVYPQACVDLQEKRDASRIFTPWKVSLFGEGEFIYSGILSIWLKSTQKSGKGLTCMSICSDLWDLNTGVPLSPQKEMAHKGMGKRDIIENLIEIAKDNRDFHFHPEYLKEIRRCFSWERIFFTKEETVAFFSQGTVTAMEDGISKFTICSEK